MELKQLNKAKTVWVNVCRFLLAAAFLFSGFVKAVDPLGLQYKLEDYLEAFGLLSLFSTSLILDFAVLLSAVEFVLGIYLLFGVRPKTTAWSIFIIMLFFTPLTLYLAISNPVSDCGCFGDAWVLTNWETFFKNIVLLVAAVSVLLWKKRIVRFISINGTWMISLFSILFILSISIYGLRHLPVFDFRPYHIGANIPQQMIGESPEYETTFIMEKEGKRNRFSLEDYPDSTWTLIDTENKVINEGKEAAIPDLSVTRVSDGEEMLFSFLESDDYLFLLILHQLNTADDSYIDKVNEIYDFAQENHYGFFAITSSNEDEISKWIQRTGAEYEFCQADDIALKTIVRSNPGLLLLKEGTILDKWGFRDIPDEKQMEAKIETLSMNENNQGIIFNKIKRLACWFFVPLLLLTGIDILTRRKKKKLNQ